MIRPSSRRHQARRPARGYTLIETMVALLLLSVGLFGMLNLTSKGLRLTGSANYRSVAAQQAQAMAEVLRANPSALGVTGTDASFAAPTAAAANACLGSSGCARNDYVGNAVAMWQSAVAAALPRGAGTVCRDDAAATNAPAVSGATINWNCSGAGQFVVKVCWDDARTPTPGGATAAAGFAAGGSGMLCTWTGL
ncbi:type IV pilus modification protein PilV [Noviherbaspirillum pedocola]|uniref:Type IV pilus modification protein PilV n=1 Tax=Noviherbaspirillum pedocola TaxID=2801341 RepID=A0A934SWX4_9BURK|nr:type IV pilus modification protein PilV [Noviherbaspirillum pedocola]MBK4738075.1 type IV pilus modification protein PilV [Noviherbaspirillum pedocola]